MSATKKEVKGGRPDPKEFKRVREAKPESDAKVPSKDNEVRIVANRGQRMYIKYAIDALTGTEGKTKHDSVVLSGMGNAVYNVVNVVEILKRRVKGLHQTTEIGSQTMIDKYEAIEEGKEGLEVERKVSIIEVVLSTKALDTKHPGYQAPLPESEVNEQDDSIVEHRERRPRKSGNRRVSDKKKEIDDGQKVAPGPRRRGDDRAVTRSAGGRGRGEGGRGGGERRDEREDRRGGVDRRDNRAPGRGGRDGSNRTGTERREGNNRTGGDRAPNRGGRGGGYSEGRREGGRGEGGGRGGGDRQ